MNLGVESGFDQRRTTQNKEFIIRIRYYTIMRAGEKAHEKSHPLYQMLYLKSLLVVRACSQERKLHWGEWDRVRINWSPFRWTGMHKGKGELTSSFHNFRPGVRDLQNNLVLSAELLKYSAPEFGNTKAEDPTKPGMGWGQGWTAVVSLGLLHINKMS